MKKNKNVLYCIIVILQGCASAEPIFKQSINSSGNKDFYQYAAKIESVEILPKTFNSTIKDQPTKNDLDQLRNKICDNKQARVTSSFQVKIVISKPPIGMALDKAEDQKLLYFANAKHYLKHRFFSSLANAIAFNPQKSDLPKTNSNFDKLMSYSTEGYYNPRTLGLNTPVSFSPKQQDIEQYYAEMRSETGSTTERYFENIDKQFFIFFFQDQVLIVPKFTQILKSGWSNRELDPTIVDGTLTRYSSTLPEMRLGDVNGDNSSDYYKFHPNIVVSDSGWVVKGYDKPVYPIQAVFADDLHFLVNHFTFTFQRDDVQTIFGYDDELRQQHFGPEYFSGKVDLDKIKRDRGFLWDQVLSKSTNLNPLSQDDHSTTYDVSLDFALFCKYGVAVSNIVTP